MKAEKNNSPDKLCGVSSRKLTASDPCLYEEIVRPWSLVNTPLERGIFGYQISYLQLPEVTFYLEQFDLRCRVRGTLPHDTMAFSVPVRLGKHSSYWKEPISESGFPAMLQGGLDAEMDKGQAQLLVLIKRSLLHSYFPAQFYTKFEQAAAMHLLPAALIEVRRLGEWLLALIRQADQQPDFLHYPATVQTIREDLLQQLKRVVHLTAEPYSRPALSKRRQGLERALEYLHINNFYDVNIPQLSEAAGVSQRTLEYAFREAFDLTALNYLRLRRFHITRRMLLSSSPTETTVARIAFSNGFYQLGHFAAAYQRLFLEKPSETLQRASLNINEQCSPLLS